MSLFIYPVMKSWVHVHAIQSHRCLVSTYIAQSADTHGSSLPDSASQVSPIRSARDLNPGRQIGRQIENSAR